MRYDRRCPRCGELLDLDVVWYEKGKPESFTMECKCGLKAIIIVVELVPTFGICVENNEI